MNHDLLRWPDLIVIGLNCAAIIGIGIYTARRTKSSDSYFLAGRRMPGWVVGLSLVGTIVSSLTFLAMPGFTYQEDWRYIPPHLTYLLAGLIGLYLFMPFFRRGNMRSAYEYLERRFGLWARLYAAAGFLLFQMFRLGVILYAVCLPFETMTGLPLTWVIVTFGILVAIYTVAGGLEAVIWTDLIQTLALIGGGLICLPILANLLPGGLSQIFTEAQADGKFSMGNTAFTWGEQTTWVLMLLYFFLFLGMMCTDQMTVQRYLAVRNDREARKGLMIGVFLTAPIWVYFSFIGTAMYVFYKNFPRSDLDQMIPEQVFPFFVLTEVPAGAAGFILSGLLAAAMSTLDSSINASAATATTDFYRRLITPDRDEQDYVKIGRWFSVLFGGIMIGVALLIHYSRSQTLMDLQTLLFSILSGGILGLFLVGFLTCRVNNRAALVATCFTFFGICLWLFLDSAVGERLFGSSSGWIPEKSWIMVLSNLFLFALSYGLSVFFGQRSQKNLRNLTLWTSEHTDVR